MRKSWKTAMVMIMMLAVAVAFGGCTTFDHFKEAFFSEKGAASSTVRIGVLEPQTGNDSKKGELEIRGIELAHKLYPEVLGKKVELVYADTQSSIYVAETAVTDLIDKKPVVVLGSYGEAVSLVASQQLREAKIPAIAMTATNPLITVNNEYYFRVSFTDASQGRALADFTYKYLGIERAAVIREIDVDSTNEVVSQYMKRMETLTGDTDAIAATIQVERNAKNYSDCIERIQRSGVRAVFMAMPVSAGEKILAAAEKAGISDMVFIVRNDWGSKDVLRLQKKYPAVRIAVAADGMTTVAGAAGTDDATSTAGSASTADAPDAAGTGEAADEPDTSQLYKQFLAAYEEEYGKNQPSQATTLGFDAYMIALQAIEEAGSIDGYRVKEALKTTEGYVGASGEISFDETGEPKKTIHVNMVQNQSLVTVYTVN